MNFPSRRRPRTPHRVAEFRFALPRGADSTRRHLFGLALVALILGTLFPAWGEDLAELPNLARIYGPHSQQADFVFLIDTSGSMKPLWPSLQRTLAGFASALPEGDHVSILGFDTEAYELLLPRTLDAAALEALRVEFPALALPRGSNTDLFRGADRLLEELNRPQANRLAFAFVLTDFRHEPARGAHSPSVTELQSKYDNYVTKTRRVAKIHALQLPLGPGAGTDFDAFSAAFGGGVRRVPLTPETIGEWFDAVRQAVERDKLRALVEDDLRAPLVVEHASGSGDHLKLRFKNSARLSLTVLSVRARTASGKEYASSAPFVVPPNAALDVVAASVAEPQGWRLDVERSWAEKLAAVDVRLAPAFEEELAKLNMATPLAMRLTAPDAQLRSGTPAWILAAAVLVLAGLALGLYRYWLAPERTFGGRAANVTWSLDDQIVGPDLQFPPKKGAWEIDRQTLLDLAGVPETGRALLAKAPDFALRFLPARPRLMSRRPRRGTYALVRSEQVLTHLVNWDESGAAPVPERLQGFEKPLEARHTHTFVLQFLDGTSSHKLSFDVTAR